MRFNCGRWECIRTFIITNTRLVSTIQIGYLHQIDYKVNDETGRDFLQLGYFIELFGKKSAKKAIENELKDN